jgi:chitinase
MLRWAAGLSAILLLPACGSGSPDAEGRHPEVPPTLGSGQPPFVRIVSPGPRTSVPEGSTITVQAVAGDPNAILARVDFYDGERRIGGKLTAPYVVALGGLDAGSHVLTAVAIDLEGITTVSAPVTVFAVKEPEEDEDDD